MIRKVIENKELARKQRETGNSVYECEEILGSMTPVKDFAAFFTNHRVDLEVIHASLLIDYCNSQTFTPQEKSAYELGLDLFLGFFKNAEANVSAYLLEMERVNKKIAGK